MRACVSNLYVLIVHSLPEEWCYMWLWTFEISYSLLKEKQLLLQLHNSFAPDRNAGYSTTGSLRERWPPPCPITLPSYYVFLLFCLEVCSIFKSFHTEWQAMSFGGASLPRTRWKRRNLAQPVLEGTVFSTNNYSSKFIQTYQFPREKKNSVFSGLLLIHYFHFTCATGNEHP